MLFLLPHSGLASPPTPTAQQCIATESTGRLSVFPLLGYSLLLETPAWLPWQGTHSLSHLVSAPRAHTAPSSQTLNPGAHRVSIVQPSPSHWLRSLPSPSNCHRLSKASLQAVRTNPSHLTAPLRGVHGSEAKPRVSGSPFTGPHKLNAWNSSWTLLSPNPIPNSSSV